MSLPARVLKHGTATAALGVAGGTTLELQGVLREADAEGWLLGVVEQVHAAATASGMKEVVVDLRGLEYCNASAWKAFVVWMRRIRETPEALYVLRVRSSPRHRWQAVGMAALRAFGADRLVIE